MVGGFDGVTSGVGGDAVSVLRILGQMSDGNVGVRSGVGSNVGVGSVVGDFFGAHNR